MLRRNFELNEKEKFYKKMYEAKNVGEDFLQEFLRKTDREWVYEQQLIVPGIREDVPTLFKTYDLFVESEVAINRHWRYEPAFCHEHEFFEMIFVYLGQAINTIGEKKYLMSSGDCCILPPGVKHSLWTKNAVVFNILMQTRTFNNTFFDTVSRNQMLDAFYKNTLCNEKDVKFIIFHCGEDEKLSMLCLNMYDEFNQKQKYHDKLLLGMVIQFFSYMMRSYENNAELTMEGNELEEKAGEIMYYLQNNYKDTSLEKMAEYFGYSTSHFSKLLKKLTGRGYIELVTRQRMEQGCYYLKNSNYTVMKISELIGYPNVEHFNRMFRKIYGITPSLYRNQNK